jgi:hypothetical protein
MSITNDIRIEAIDKKTGMTLGELRQFIAACDGADDSTKVKVRVTFKGTARELTAYVGR